MSERRGARVVFVIMGVLVAVAGGFGFLLGAVVLPRQASGDLPPAEVGPVTFPITPFTLAAYGVVTVGSAVCVIVLVVAYVSNRYVDRDAATESV